MMYGQFNNELLFSSTRYFGDVENIKRKESKNYRQFN